MNDSRWRAVCGAVLRALKTFALPIVLIAGAMLAAAPSAKAFGCQAHEIVAMIAERHLSPRALASVQELLKENPIDPALSRYCRQSDLDAMAYASTWADDYRSTHRETASWHQIDIPITLDRGDLYEFCAPPEGCITQALKDQIAILRASDSNPQMRADALRFVIHFMGDLHAPLHTANNNDMGGNCIPVTFFGEMPKFSNPQYESYAPNLHGMWDYGIYQRAFRDRTMQQSATEYKDGFKDQTVQESAVKFDREFSSSEAKWMLGPVDVDAWTWESFQVAKKVVYGKLPVPVPVEVPNGNKSCSGDNHISERMLKLNERLGPKYQKIALPVFKQQIAKAGARLALVLNQIWP